MDEKLKVKCSNSPLNKINVHIIFKTLISSFLINNVYFFFSGMYQFFVITGAGQVCLHAYTLNFLNPVAIKIKVGTCYAAC